MSTRKVLAYSFLDRYANHLLAVISIMVLSRLLTPHEIGQFAITMVFVSLLSTLRDFGAGQYIVQEKELTTVRIRAAWTVQLGVGITLSVITAMLGSPAAAFFGVPVVEDLMLILALNFAVTPFGSITYAWLSRNMLFGRLAVIRFSGALTNTLTAILLACYGFGAYSLAWGNLAGACAIALIATGLRPADLPWLPGRQDISRVVTFGSRSTMFAILTSISVEAPQFMLGKFRGATDAGLFSRANGFLNTFHVFVMQAVQAVTLPAFSSIEREGGAVEPLFLRAVSYTTALGWAFGLASALLADPFVRFFYGDQWTDTVVAVRVLSLAAAPTIPLYLCAQILISKGSIHVNVRLGAFTAAAALVAAFIGAQSGLLGVAWAMIPVALLMALLWSSETAKVLTLRRSDVMSTLVKSLKVAISANIVPAAVVVAFGFAPDSIWLPLMLAIPGGAVGFMVAAYAIDHPIWREIQVLHAVAARRLGLRS